MINILKMLENITIILVLYEESDEIIFENLDKIKNFKIIILGNVGNKSLQKKLP